MIRNHKMYSAAGPAMLIFDKLGIVYLEVHIHLVCHHIACDRSLLNVLLSLNKNTVAWGTISKDIYSQWM